MVERPNDSLTNDGNDFGQNETTAGGGAVRSVFKSFKSVAESVRAVTLRGISHAHAPSATSTRVVAKSAERIGFAVEAQKEETRDEGKQRRPVSFDQRGRWSRIVHVMAAGVPSFIKATLLGTLVFDVYEHMACKISASCEHSPAPQVLSPFVAAFARTHPVLSDSVIAVAAGATGGLVHALGYVAWNKGASMSRRVVTSQFSHGRLRWLSGFLSRHGIIGIGGRLFRPVAPVHTWGTCVSHSLIYASLFGTYETTKLFLLGVVDSVLLPAHSNQYDAVPEGASTSDSGSSSDQRRARAQARIRFEHYSGFVCVALAGGVAGVVSETVTAVTEGLELEAVGMRQAIRKLCSGSVRLLPPKGHLLAMTTLVPNVLGFLAYEYGKDIIGLTLAAEHGPTEHLNALRRL